VIGGPAPQVVVQKCTQLLQVNPSLGPDAQKALDDVKANGGDPTAAFEQSNEKLKTQAGNLSGALSAKLSCDPGQSVFEIPAGGADPCDIPSLSAALGEAHQRGRLFGRRELNGLQLA
jgi:hypothetical protein